MMAIKVIGIILVVAIVLFIKNKSKKKKNALGFQRETTNVSETEEQEIKVDNNSKATLQNLDSSHWANTLLNQVENEPYLRNTLLPDELNDVVNKIVAIPHDFNKLGNKSKYQLTIESGYMEAHELITRGVILDALMKQPHRIDEWMQWSEDQRVSEGWCLRKYNDIWQIIAFSTKGGYNETSTSYTDLQNACATFIKLEVEYTRQLVNSDSKKVRKKR